jgi:uncharacterized damage-inducible protein DinB
VEPSEPRANLIAQIRRLPELVADLIAPLGAEELTARPIAGEWSVAQNVHHLCDSHMNSYIRCKLMLTEERPPLKPYDQDAWAELPDASSGDLSESLALLHGLHARWTRFWEHLPADAWGRTGIHLADGEVDLDYMLRTYAAHGEGHLEQIARTITALGRQEDPS